MKCLYPLTLRVSADNPKWPHAKNEIIVGCGQCINCRINYANQWAGRLFIEHLQSIESYFITLTHDDEHIKIIDGQPTLCKYDLQLFFKRLRKKLGNQSFRYYACGEYGDTRLRSHYHFLSYFKIKYDYINLYHDIKKAWGKGNIDMVPTEARHYKYITEYLTSRLTGQWKLIFIRETGLEPEFTIMSRNPGIGTISNHNDIMSYYNDGFITNGKQKFPLHQKYKEFMKYYDPRLHKKKQLEQIAIIENQPDYDPNMHLNYEKMKLFRKKTMDKFLFLDSVQKL